ncbi:MAG: cysteine rich repeat-containing protein [Pseudomonadota bacterium]
MKKILTFVLIALAFSITAQAENMTMKQYLQEACKEDIQNYCSQVTPGEGRLLACAAAHEDKLSGQCSYALYQAAETLDALVNTINYIAAECKNEIETLCANVKAGEGRILTCLDNNSDKISGQCDTALARTVIKVEE